MALSVVFKASVQVHCPSFHRKESIDKAKVWLYVVVHPVLKTVSYNTGRDEYEGVGVAVGK